MAGNRKHRFLQRSILVSILSLFFCQALSAAPKKGGTLVYARGGDSVGLDPANETDGESLNVTDQIFDTIVRLKLGTTEVEPSLAQSWSVSKDNLTYTFKLRPGVKFHDDTPVNADAVIYSLMRQKDPNHPAAKYGGPYEYFISLDLGKTIGSINKVDDLTVSFVLTRPDATFLSCLAMPPFAVVSPTAMEKYKKDFRQNPVGSGPYRFVKWEKSQKIILKANDKYWDGRPYLDSVVIRSVPDNSTRLLEMLSGNVHVMDGPSPDDIKVLRDKMKEKVVLAQQAGLNVGYLAMNNEHKPFDNVKVRQALNYAINKKGIIDAVYAGYAQPAKNAMPPTLWGYAKDSKEYGYDIEKAKKLLAEAGVATGFETTIWAMPVSRPYMPNGRKVAEAIQADLAKVGIKAKIVSYEWGTYLDKTKVGEHDLALLGWTGDIGDPDNFLYILLDKDNAAKPASNISFYKNDKVHDLLVQAKRESDQKKRSAAYQQAQKLIAEDAPMVPIAHSTVVVPISSKVKDFVMDPTGRRNFAKVWIE